MFVADGVAKEGVFMDSEIHSTPLEDMFDYKEEDGEEEEEEDVPDEDEDGEDNGQAAVKPDDKVEDNKQVENNNVKDNARKDNKGNQK